MWVAFLIPKIEDGNNFGVGVQEDTLEEIRTVESEASMFYEQMSRYYYGRAKLVSKVRYLVCWTEFSFFFYEHWKHYFWFIFQADQIHSLYIDLHESVEKIARNI